MPASSAIEKAAIARMKCRRVYGVFTRVVSVAVESEGQERQLNIHVEPQFLGGVYANFANVSFSDYEFTITFARIDHEVEDGDIPGVVVSRVNMSTRFMKELLDAMQDSWSKWSAREGIRNLPEAPAPLPTSPRPSHSDPLHEGRVVVEDQVRRSRRARVAEARRREPLEERLHRRRIARRLRAPSSRPPPPCAG